MEKEPFGKNQLPSESPEADAGKASSFLYRAIYQQSSIGTVLFTPDGRLTDMNPAAMKILGLLDLSGIDAINLFDDIGFPEAFKESIRRAESAVFTAPLDFDRVNGSRKIRTLRQGVGTLEFQIIPLRDEIGQTMALLGILLDFTERQANEDALSESESRYRMLFDANGDALLVHDLQGKILDANRTALEMLGYERNELINRYLQDIGSPDPTSKIQSRIDDLRQSRFTPFEGKLVAKDGRVIPVEVNTTAIEYNGQPAALGVARDITERKIAEKRILELNERFAKTFEINPMPMGLSFYEDGRILDVNRSFLKIFGYRKDEVVGQTTVELGLLPAEDRQRLLQELERHGHTRHFKVHVKNRPGQVMEGLMEAEIIMLGTRQCLLITFSEIHLEDPAKPAF